jgi:hypothetical protein
MRVNLIGNHRKNTQDINIMRGLLSAIFENNVSIQLVQYAQPQCVEADINIFFEVVNPSLLSYAFKNIWIPDHHTALRVWSPYLNMVNEIWAKTREDERIFKELTPTYVRYTGWTSLNKQFPDKKNYYKAIISLDKNPYSEIDLLFRAYEKIQKIAPIDYSRLPILHVISTQSIEVPLAIKDRTKLYQKITDNERDELLAECGLYICLSKADGFSHLINESMASGCNVIVSSNKTYLEDIVGEANLGAQFVDKYETKENLECFGKLITSDIDSLVEKLQDYYDLSFKERKHGSEFMREVYEGNHRIFMERMRSLLPQVFHVETPYSLKDAMPKEDELPDVSIICVTRDRRIFMPILKYSYMIQSYPEEKLELIIVDDGDDPIEDTLIGIPNVVYVRLDEKKTIGEKRNIGVSKAMYDVITFMDDDDVYPNNSVLERTAMMLKTPLKECAFCSVIPCYDIANYCSFMNIPPITLPMSQRVSEATLIFTKKFWNERKFGDTQIAEGDAFIRGREHMCRELSPQEVIVSLVHPKNTSSRKTPDFKEPNGCHFGFNEKLFAMVSEIGEQLKANLETK